VVRCNYILGLKRVASTIVVNCVRIAFDECS